MAAAVRGLLLLALLAVSSTFVAASSSSLELARGWGEAYRWETLDAAKAAAAADGKGVMVVIWKSWCGACKALRPKFADDQNLQSAVRTTGWHIVNTSDDEEPTEDLYKPDGGYIPRIIFLDSNGKRLDVGSGNPKYSAFFAEPKQIADALRKANALIESKGSEL